ncbi:MAG: ATP-binding protein, partial [Pseudomonadota bacterium]|nr:ATP-binding protein [Pseudomonadota bacterium]
PAKADPNQVEMAILNLAVNARDAMPDGGTLRISAIEEHLAQENTIGLPPGDYLRLSVADTGAGMDQATLARAVEPFFSTKGIGRGTGLGLSMVHGLASQLGGTLAISSRVGIGTNVELWLPRSAASVSNPGDAKSESVPRLDRTVTVLLVDDELLVRLSTADILQDLGYDVIEAGSADEAMATVERGEQFDLLITDHLMPGMTGTQLIALMRERRPGVPALLISGYADLEGIDPGLQRLTKPFRGDDLANKLNMLLPDPTAGS